MQHAHSHLVGCSARGYFGRLVNQEGMMFETTQHYRDRLKVLNEQTEAQRQARADAEQRHLKAFEDMQGANDLERMRAAMKLAQGARIAEGVAKSTLIAALEMELCMVKLELERLSPEVPL